MREDTLQLLILTIFLLVYMIIGAGIFTALELSNEKRTRTHYNNVFMSFAKENNLSNSAVTKLLNTHEEACLLGYGFNKTDKWDFIGSFYFTGTVLTTIGFGLSAPSTVEGQIFFIFYAFIGIPINILYLNTILQRIVTLLSRLVRKGYDYMPRNKLFTPPGPKELPLGEILIVSFIIFSIASLILAIVFTFIEKWTFFEAIYFLVVACSTVGFGDYVPGKVKTSIGHNSHDAYRLLNWFLISIGLVFIYVVLNLMANFFKNILSYSIKKCKQYACPCLNIQVEPFDPTTTKTKGSAVHRTGRVSRLSIMSDGEGQDLGSFAAIQSALDRLKSQAESNATEGSTELTALTNIEQLLKSEYMKVQSMQGNSNKAKWKRAANKARILSPSTQQTRQVDGIAQRGRNLSRLQPKGTNNNNKNMDSYEDLPGTVLDRKVNNNVE